MDKPLILHIEDDRIYAAIVRSFLESQGFRYHQESSGEEGFKKIREKQPALVLLDIGLPQMDGFEVLKRIRDDSELYHIPVFMLSRLSDKEDVLKSFALGANQYLVKQQHPMNDLRHHISRQLAIE